MTNSTSPQRRLFQPPKLAERILSLLLMPEDAETVLGDFAEICNQQNNQRQANSWYWKETSAPPLPCWGSNYPANSKGVLLL